MRLGKILSLILSGGAKPESPKEIPAEESRQERRDQSQIGKGKRADFDLQEQLFRERWDKRRDKALQMIEQAVANPVRNATAYSISRRGEQLKQGVLRAHQARSEGAMRIAEDEIFIFQKQGR